jgi:hypothetical protein
MPWLPPGRCGFKPKKAPLYRRNPASAKPDAGAQRVNGESGWVARRRWQGGERGDAWRGVD